MMKICNTSSNYIKVISNDLYIQKMLTNVDSVFEDEQECYGS